MISMRLFAFKYCETGAPHTMQNKSFGQYWSCGGGCKYKATRQPIELCMRHDCVPSDLDIALKAPQG